MWGTSGEANNRWPVPSTRLDGRPNSEVDVGVRHMMSILFSVYKKEETSDVLSKNS